MSNPDEGRYTEIPREMAAANDYVTPRLNGVKYFEKPPLLYWLTAAAIEVGGVNEWSARFWCAVFAAVGCVLTYAAGRALFGRAAGVWAATVLATSLFYYILSRVLLLDLAVAVLMAGALFAFLGAMRLPPGRQRRWLFWAFYGAMALATLTKGLMGFALTGLVAFVWVLTFNRWKQLWPFYPFSGTALLLLIAAPWHVLAARANGDFLYFYFVHEHYLRFTTTIHDRYEPWWYFGPIILAGMVPWIAFLGQSLHHNLKEGNDRKDRTEVWFLVIWVLVITGFFSFSKSKLPPYIMPIFPPLAVLIGRYLADVTRIARAPRGFSAGLWGFIGLASVLAGAIAWVKLSLPAADLESRWRLWRFVLGGILAGGAGAVAWGTLRGKTGAALRAVVVSMAVFLTGTNFVIGLLDTRSSKPLAIALLSRLQPGDDVYCVGEYIQDFPVYLQRQVNVVDYEGELAFGIHAEPERTKARFMTTPAFGARWKEGRTAYALVASKYKTDYFDRANLPCTVIAQTGRYVLVTNRTP